LNGILRKKLGGPRRGQAKIWGVMVHPGPSLESPLRATLKNEHFGELIRTASTTYRPGFRGIEMKKT